MVTRTRIVISEKNPLMFGVNITQNAFILPHDDAVYFGVFDDTDLIFNTMLNQLLHVPCLQFYICILTFRPILNNETPFCS